MRVIVDTREQNPLWSFDEPDVIKQKLDEGDYTTPELFGKAHIERKSGIDLYGSIIQGHTRFRAELVRAQNKGLNLAVFVECPKSIFVSKKFEGGYRLKCKPAALAKIVDTMQQKYNVEFVWCEDRDDLRFRAVKWFEQQLARLNCDLEAQHGKTTADNPG